MKWFRFWICLGCLSLSGQKVTAADWLDQAEQEFFNGNLAKAKATVEKNQFKQYRLSKVELVQFFAMKARLAVSSPNDLNEILQELLKVDPRFEFDLYLDPPILHASWKRIRSDRPAEPTKPQTQKKYWVSLLPFGIGHYEHDQMAYGAMYSLVDLFFVFYDQERISGHHYRILNSDQNAVSLFGLYTSWGYQVLHLLPDLYRTNPEATETVAEALSFVPFGVGQLKNGETTKAYTFALLQGSLLAMGVLNTESKVRDFSYSAFVMAALYGFYDAHQNHRPGLHKAVGMIRPRLFVNQGREAVALEWTREF